MANQKGVSLVMAAAVLLIVFFLSMISLTTVTSYTVLTRSLYGQSITLNVAEDGPELSTPALLNDAQDGFFDLLQTGNPILAGKVVYDFGDVNVLVIMRDNVDLDDDDSVDVDKRFILNAVGTMAGGGRTELEFLIQYIGNDDEYAQETGGSKSISSYSSETNVSGI